MPRVKRGVTAKARHKKILTLSKGYRGRRSNVYRIAKEAVMKAMGVGELGSCGVAAAVANAIYNATGVRVRDYPVTLDKLLPGMPRYA